MDDQSSPYREYGIRPGVRRTTAGWVVAEVVIKRSACGTMTEIQLIPTARVFRSETAARAYGVLCGVLWIDEQKKEPLEGLSLCPLALK